MINLSTPPERIIQELSEDYPKAVYWAKNKDKESLEWLRNRQHAVLTESEVRMGPDYTSANGNRWLIFYIVQPVAKTAQNAVALVTFCYYETIGSIGAFCLINGDHIFNQLKVNGCCIYTSHFFRRLSERSGTTYQSKDMLMAFVQSLDRFDALVDDGEVLKPGEVVVSLQGGQGRGVILSENPLVYEIRTFIPTTLYNSKQKAAEQKLEQSKDADCSETLPMLVTHCRILLERLGYVSSRDADFWRQCPVSCANYFLEATRRWHKESPSDCEAVYLMLLEGIARQMGLAHFDTQKAKEQICKHLLIQHSGNARTTSTPSLLDVHRPKRRW